MMAEIVAFLSHDNQSNNPLLLAYYYPELEIYLALRLKIPPLRTH